MGEPRTVSEGKKYRLVIEVEGGRHSVVIQVPDRRELSTGYEKYFASQLCIKVDQLTEVLDNWTPEQLVEHLEAQDPAVLRRNIFGVK